MAGTAVVIGAILLFRVAVPPPLLAGVVWVVGPTWKKKRRKSFRSLMEWKLDVDTKWHRKKLPSDG